MTAATAVRVITGPVTQDHIDRGRPLDCDACPVALALLDAIPGARHAQVIWNADVIWNGAADHIVATIWDGQGPLTGWLDPVADRFIRDFDRGEPVGPFTFTFTIEETA